MTIFSMWFFTCGCNIINVYKNSGGLGDEKGNFEFGGSTIILFVKDNVIKIDDDILENSKNFMETTVNVGERIAKKIN